MAFLNPEFLIAAMRASTWRDIRSDFVPDEDAALFEVDEVLDSVKAAPRSWDSKFVLRSAYYTYYDTETKTSAWPIPMHLTTPELAVYGEGFDILRMVPEAGDIFLQWGQAQKAFIHCGVIDKVGRGFATEGMLTSIDLYTVEGDTDENLDLHGGKVKRGIRTMRPVEGDRFLRWRLLDVQNVRPEHRLKTVRNPELVMGQHPEGTPLPSTAEGVNAFVPKWGLFEDEVMEQVKGITNSRFDQDDLLQEAKWKLLTLDPTSIDTKLPENVLFIHQALRRHVNAVWDRGPEVS